MRTMAHPSSAVSSAPLRATWTVVRVLLFFLILQNLYIYTILYFHSLYCISFSILYLTLPYTTMNPGDYPSLNSPMFGGGAQWPGTDLDKNRPRLRLRDMPTQSWWRSATGGCCWTRTTPSGRRITRLKPNTSRRWSSISVTSWECFRLASLSVVHLFFYFHFVTFF